MSSVPKLTDEATPQQFGGCLQFGNRGDTTNALFLGIAEDKLKVDEERRRGCRASITKANASPIEKVQDIILEFRNFFPSDSKNPTKTMLKIEGAVGLKVSGPQSYYSFLSYKIDRYGGGDGLPSDLILRPNFVRPSSISESYAQVFAKQNGSDIRLKDVGTVGTQFDAGPRPQLVYASYEFFDRNNQIVGSVAVPLFVSQELK